MTNKLSWDEILATFRDEWVELIDYNWDLSEPNPSNGVVKTHSKNREDFNRMILEDPSVDSAVIFAGRIKLPENSYLHSNLRIARK